MTHPNPTDDLEAVDPRYEVDVQYEVWQGMMMVAASDDLNEARRYDDLYQPCSLLKATTYRQPVGLPDAHTDLRPAGVVEAVAWPPGEVTDEWADRFCEAINWSPDGQECKVVEGEIRCTTLRQIAKGHILAAIATQPDATPAHPDAALMERVRTGLQRIVDGYDAKYTARALLSDLKAEAGR